MIIQALVFRSEIKFDLTLKQKTNFCFFYAFFHFFLHVAISCQFGLVQCVKWHNIG